MDPSVFRCPSSSSPSPSLVRRTNRKLSTSRKISSGGSDGGGPDLSPDRTGMVRKRNQTNQSAGPTDLTYRSENDGKGGDGKAFPRGRNGRELIYLIPYPIREIRIINFRHLHGSCAEAHLLIGEQRKIALQREHPEAVMYTSTVNWRWIVALMVTMRKLVKFSRPGFLINHH